MQQRTPGSSKASEVSGRWARRRVRELESTPVGCEKRPGNPRRALKRGARVAALAWRRVAIQSAAAGVLQHLKKSPVTPSGPHNRFQGCGVRGTRCELWRARPRNLVVVGRGAACEKAQEVPRGSWPPPRFRARSLRWSQQFSGGGEGRRERREGCAGELVTVCSEECNCPCDRGRRGRGARSASFLLLRCRHRAGFGWKSSEHLEGLAG